ncbi:MAG: leucine-rich repeat protein, partial [Anaerotignum sp.]|nr:leucine-rich repeat protein [Anaerotignum sp.]
MAIKSKKSKAFQMKWKVLGTVLFLACAVSIFFCGVVTVNISKDWSRDVIIADTVYDTAEFQDFFHKTLDHVVLADIYYQNEERIKAGEAVDREDLISGFKRYYGIMDGVITGNTEINETYDGLIVYGEIPASLQKTTDAYINEYAYGYVYGPFYGCDNLKEVTFEAGTTVIANDVLANCPGLRSVTIPDTVTVIKSGAFGNCVNLGQVTLSKNTTTIEGHAFKNSKIAEISFPDSVTSIGAAAFANCQNLQSVALPKGLNTIAAHTFYNCDNITSVWVTKALEKTTDAYINEYAHGYVHGPFYDCDGLKEITFEEGTSIVANDLFANCPGIEKVVIPDTVTSVKSGAFANAVNLADVTLSKNTTAIE